MLSNNMYAYCANNPVTRIDADGCDWEDSFWTGVGIAVTGLALLAAIPTGGGSLALAQLGISVSAATAAAQATVGAGLCQWCEPEGNTGVAGAQ